MATIGRHKENTITQDNPLFSELKAIVESSFAMNNTARITSVGEAYELAAAAPGTIVLEQEVAHAEELGLPSDAKVLLDNGGAVSARTAAARYFVGDDADFDKKVMDIAKQVIYDNRERQFYHTEAIVGLDEEFMVKAHLNTSEEQVANLYSWLINFQPFDGHYAERYKNSKVYEENDIYVYFDPEWEHPDFPHGLAYFDPVHNTALVLGLQYFGEIKKGTLTLAWGTAQRNNYVPCHGGVKIFRQESDNFVSSFFGLSGSGKSTLTHAKHDDKYDIQVLHDDAFIIDKDDKNSIALEPSYYDKTYDYPAGHPEQDYFVISSNVGVTRDTDGKLQILAEDIRNGNGRTVKSRYATDNRVDHIDEKIDAIFWIIKDDSLPPLVKVTEPELASIFGATLMTKRSSAENIVGKKPKTNLVIEPYANPFRVYPLKEDYNNFKDLFEGGVEGYLINTGDFYGKDIPKKVTLSALESVVERRDEFETFGKYENLSYLPLEGFEPPFDDQDYQEHVNDRLQVRLDWIKKFNQENPDHPLPDTAIEKLENLMK